MIPADRITNPLYKLYTGFLPSPNTNPTASNQQPINNYYDTGQPDPLRSHVFGVRLDYNHSDRNRFFGRVSGSNFTEGAGDWTYESAPGLHALSRVRKTRAGTGTWTRVSGDTVIDGQLGANRFLETDQRLGLKDYTPGGIGLPAYMDQFCQSRGDFGGVTPCQLPRINFGGANLNGNFYQVLGDNSGTFDQGTHYQGQLNLSQVRGSHTLRAGVDFRRHERFRNFPGNASGNFTFDNTYTRKADDTVEAPAANLGLGWAAFMLGIPTRVEAEMTASSLISNHWVGTFFQDTWRVSENITLNFGLRHEFETGLTDQERPDAHRLRPERGRRDRATGRGGVCQESDSTTCTERLRRERRNRLRRRFGSNWPELGRTIDVDAARVRLLVDERANRSEGWLRHVLRRAECHELHAQPAWIQRNDGQRSKRRLRADVAPRRSEERHLADVGSVSCTEHRDALRPGDRQLARRQHGARHPFPGSESQSRPPARAAMARRRAARAHPQHGRRDCLQR